MRRLVRHILVMAALSGIAAIGGAAAGPWLPARTSIMIAGGIAVGSTAVWFLFGGRPRFALNQLGMLVSAGTAWLLNQA